jgi:CheY-like chemotaxis protein
MSHTHPRLLVVEDDEDALSFICSMLGEIKIGDGHLTIKTATNGKEAIRLLKTESFDLLITDLHMPELPGDHLIRSVRDLDNNNRLVPIIVISGYLEDLTKSDSIRSLEGTLYILEKPFASNELEQLIQIWLSDIAS